MNEKITPIGFDDGFAESKIAWRDIDTGEIRTLSFATAAQNGAMFADVLTPSGGISANQVGVYDCDGEIITVTPQNDGESLRSDGYHTSLSNRAVLQHALQSVGLAGSQAFVTAGLPVGQYYFNGAVAQALIDKKVNNIIGSVTVVGGKAKPAKVRYAQVLSQAVAAYVDLLVDDAGNANTEINDERIGIVDVGGSTTDCVVLQAGQVLLESATTHKVGTLDLLGHLESAIRPIVDVRVPRHRLSKALKEKRIVVFGHDIDLADVIESAVLQKRHAVLDAVNRAFSGGDRVDRIILVGGGASLFEACIKQRYPGVVDLVADAAFANARGMLKQAEASLTTLQTTQSAPPVVKAVQKNAASQLRAV